MNTKHRKRYIFFIKMPLKNLVTESSLKLNPNIVGYLFSMCPSSFSVTFFVFRLKNDGREAYTTIS